MTFVRLALAALMLAVGQPAPAAAGGSDVEARRCADLPAPIAGLSQAIRAAAAARDYDALGALIDPARFTYSFGDGGDPIAYWRQRESEGADVPAAIVAVLDMPCAVVVDGPDISYYVWPSAFELLYAELTEAERVALRALYPGKPDDYYWDGGTAGNYIGWRLFVSGDGRWQSFIEGD